MCNSPPSASKNLRAPPTFCGWAEPPVKEWRDWRLNPSGLPSLASTLSILGGGEPWPNNESTTAEVRFVAGEIGATALGSSRDQDHSVYSDAESAGERLPSKKAISATRLI